MQFLFKDVPVWVVLLWSVIVVGINFFFVYHMGYNDAMEKVDQAVRMVTEPLSAMNKELQRQIKALGPKNKNS